MQLKHFLMASVTSGLLSMTAAANAQPTVGRYEPTRPTTSPYLNLLRRNTGPLPNYYTFVRPQQVQNQINQQQQAAIGRNAKSVEGLGQRLTGVENAAPTGTGSTFMNYSHFYPSRGAVGPQNQNRAPLQIGR